MELCTDILERIWSHLGFENLLICSGVCRQWKNLSFDDTLWRKKYLEEWGDENLIDGSQSYFRGFRLRQELRPCLTKLLKRWVCPGRANKEECAESLIHIAPWLVKDLKKLVEEGSESASHALWLAREAELCRMWRELLSETSASALEKGACIIARLEDPNLNPAIVTNELDRLAARVMFLGTNVNLRSQLNVINRVLFEEEGFRGNDTAYSDPRNSFIDQVLRRKTGIPVSLSVVYMAIAHRLGIPLEGVHTPLHFLIRAKTDDDEFFIDAFNKGRILSEADVRDFLIGQGVNFHSQPIVTCSIPAVFARMLRNLCLIYSERSQNNNYTLRWIRERFMLCVSQLLVVSDGLTEDLHHLDEEVQYYRIFGSSRLLQA